jgi:hypothetical protein
MLPSAKRRPAHTVAAFAVALLGGDGAVAHPNSTADPQVPVPGTSRISMPEEITTVEDLDTPGAGGNVVQRTAPANRTAYNVRRPLPKPGC